MYRMSHRVNALACAGLFCLALSFAAPAAGNAASLTIYVATNGNDTWNGRLPAPNPNQTDGPLATWDRARQLIKSLDKTSLTEINVQFRGGTYYIPATIDFQSVDSGIGSMPIVYQNYPGEQPIFTGSIRVQNWKNVGGNKWVAQLPSNTVVFENLFYNSERRLRPRLGGYLGQYLRIAGPVTVDKNDLPNTPLNQNCQKTPSGDYQCFDRFKYSPSDPISDTWLNLVPATVNGCGAMAPQNQSLAGDIEILNFEQFNTSKLRISCIDTTNQIIYLTGTTTFDATQDGFQAGRRYLVENVEDALTEPGQWFLNHSVAGKYTLTYLAYPGENPNFADVEIPQTPPPFVRTFNLQYVTFQGLTFQQDNYTLPCEGHPSRELEVDIAPVFSIQDSNHITIDSDTFRQISGTGLEILTCLPADSPPPNLPAPLNAPPVWCAGIPTDLSTTYNVVKNSAFYDIGALGVRIGDPYVSAETQNNIPQFTTVENNTVEGYGRIIPSSFGIGQGMGHDNTYTHNDVYDGYHCAISISEQTTVKPDGTGNSSNVISFNHVFDLLQGIESDGGAIRIESGNGVYTSPGNKIFNNKIHDVSDSSASLDPCTPGTACGYGGNGVYLDNSTGDVEVYNNLVYRVSDTAVYTPHGPAPSVVDGKPAYNGTQANLIQNNILAFARKALIGVNWPYADWSSGTDKSAQPSLVFTVQNNIFLFDRSSTSSGGPFYVLGQCSYTNGEPFNHFEAFSSNLYWRTDGSFSTDLNAFFLQNQPDWSAPNNPPCSDPVHRSALWTPYLFTQWQQAPFDEDSGSVDTRSPGFVWPFFPIDDYWLLFGSPGVGFKPFDPNEAGRAFTFWFPPRVAPTFLTAPYNPWTDF